MSSPRVPTVARLLLIPASLFFALLIAEILLRVMGVAYPRWLENDPLLGSVHRPGVTFRQKDEGNATVRINSGGFRDRERSVEKPPGTVRIAVLGDSYVEAAQVEQEDVFTTVMERELNGCRAFGEHPVEVLNFGVTGYGTAQELLLLEKTVWGYDPDVVVLAFLTGNDLRNNTARLLRDPGRPYFIYQDSTLVYDSSFRKTFAPEGGWKRKTGRFLLDHSRVAQLVYRARAQAQKRRSALARKDTAAARPALELGLDDQIYLPPADPGWTEAWKITEELIRMMNAEVRKKSARFLVVNLSNAVQVNPDSTFRREAMTRIGTRDLFYPDDRIAALGAREDFPVLILARPLLAFAEEHRVQLHGFKGQNLGTGHWNEEGHRVAGRLIADDLARRFGSGPCANTP